MAGELIAGLGALKTAFDLAKGLKDIDSAVGRNAAVIELQERILAAQSAQSALIEKVGQLEKEVASLKAWEAEKGRYELLDLGRGGFFAYCPKEGEERGEPPHAICTNCYSRGFKSILHLTSPRDLRDRTWDCPSCKARIPNQNSSMGKLISEARSR